MIFSFFPNQDFGDSVQQYCYKCPLLGDTQSNRGQFWAMCCIQSRPLVAATFTSGHFPVADIRDRIGMNHFRCIPDCVLSRPGSYLISKLPSTSPVCSIGRRPQLLLSRTPRAEFTLVQLFEGLYTHFRANTAISTAARVGAGRVKFGWHCSTSGVMSSAFSSALNEKGVRKSL